LQKFSR